MSGPAVPNAVVEGCSGALGSVIALLATYPLKTIYTLQALSTGDTDVAVGTTEATSRLLAVARFLQQYKLSTLYAGLGPNVVESALSSGVYFFFYSKLREQAVAWRSKQRLGAPGTGGNGGGGGRDLTVLASLLVATAAGALNQLITMPASVVATRMQGYQSLAKSSPSAAVGAKGRAPTAWQTIASVFREGGLGGFWKGLLPSMILLANPAVQYMLFERIKAALRHWKAQRSAAAAAAEAEAEAEASAPAVDAELLARRCSADSDEAMAAAVPPPPKAAGGAADSPLSAGEVFLAGALAKVGATVVTYPLIVVKARLQASSSSMPSSSGSGSGGAYRSSTWGVIADTARNEGLGGFFKGLRAKILQTALNAALMLMLKEQLHGATKAALSVAAGGGAASADANDALAAARPPPTRVAPSAAG